MKLNKSVVCAFARLAALACTKENRSGRAGHISFSVSSDGTVAESTRANVSDYTTLPASSDFSIEVTGDSFSWTGKISEWDASTALAAGNYSVKANYGSNEEEGFDKPYFTGTKSFAVQGGQTASVSIPVSLGNTIVKVSCTDMFRNFFPAYAFSLTRDGGRIVDFAQGETRAAFVDGYKFHIEGSFTNQAGKASTFSKEYTNLYEKTCYTLTFDADNVGGATLSISFNDTVETVELGDTELND